MRRLVLRRHTGEGWCSACGGDTSPRVRIFNGKPQKGKQGDWGATTNTDRFYGICAACIRAMSAALVTKRGRK